QFCPPDLFDSTSIYGEVSKETSEFEYQCVLNPSHITGLHASSLVVDLFGGGRELPDFVSLSNHAFLIVSEEFSEKLSTSGLTGWLARDCVKIGANQSDANKPKVLLLEMEGCVGVCSRFRVKGGENTCPFCKLASVVCPAC